MFTIPAASTSSAAVETAPAARNRLIALLVTVAVAAALLLTPQFSTAAHATTAPKHQTASQIAAGWAKNMLAMLNKERKAHKLSALTMSTKLIKSAHTHNADMAKHNTMSHQLPGEAFFADRITKAGYKWQAAGENIGWNSATTNSALLSLETTMYNEKAPNDGHRLNILSKNFREVGIDVYWDKPHHKMWFTQDFGHKA